MPLLSAVHIPTAVAVEAAVVDAAGSRLNATQFVPSTVASNVIVADSVPVICTATAPGDGNPSTVAACSAADTVITLDLSNVAAMLAVPLSK
jgi:hypothetical protein